MFEIKPRERQLRARASQAAGVTLWGSAGAAGSPRCQPQAGRPPATHPGLTGGGLEAGGSGGPDAARLQPLPSDTVPAAAQLRGCPRRVPGTGAATRGG